MLPALRRGWVDQSATSYSRVAFQRIQSNRHIHTGLQYRLNQNLTPYYHRTSHFGSPRLTTIRSVRAYSNVLPDPPKSSLQGSEPLPPPTPHPRKAKIELKPSPIKPSSLSPGQTTTSFASKTTPHGDAAVARQSPLSTETVSSPPNPSPPESISTSVKETVSDVTEAAKHGILEPPPEGAGRVAKLWHQFKQLFKFYWRGVKMLFQHRKLAIAIRNRVSEDKKKGEKSSMTRWESQFLRTYDQDMIKLIPFMLIIITLEEILPLVVLYAPFLLPSTCILPSQLDRIAAKADEKKLEAVVSAQFLLRAMGEDAALSANQVGAGGLNGLSGEMAWTLCSLMSLSNKGPLFMLRRRLRKHLTYLSFDDALLATEHNGASLTTEEVRDALKERGFMSHGVTEPQLRSGLKQWLANGKNDEERLSFVLRHALEIDTTKPPSLKV